MDLQDHPPGGSGGHKGAPNPWSDDGSDDEEADDVHEGDDIDDIGDEGEDVVDGDDVDGDEVDGDDDDEDEADDDGDVHLVDVNNLEPNVTYVLVRYEGLVFPGLVKVVGELTAIVSCMVHVPSKAHRSLWKWPEKADELIYELKDILAIIDTPTMIGKRGNYKVPEAENYM